MSISESLLPELDREMANTRKTLERVPMDRFDWKPHERSFSLGALANHVSRLLWWGAETVRTESLDLAPKGEGLQGPPVVRTTEELLAAFDEGLADFRRAVEGAGDEDFLFPWTLYRDGEPLFTLPRAVVIRNTILNHIIHHRGQLTVYLRMNEVPLPALYGPSADESS